MKLFTNYRELESTYKDYMEAKNAGLSDKEIAKSMHHSVTKMKQLAHEYEVRSSAPDVKVILEFDKNNGFSLNLKRWSNGKWFTIKKEEVDANPNLLERISQAMSSFNSEELDQLSLHIPHKEAKKEEKNA